MSSECLVESKEVFKTNKNPHTKIEIREGTKEATERAIML